MKPGPHVLTLPGPHFSLPRREAELAELRGVVGALDAERDTLQAELDRKAEAAVMQAEAMAGGQRQLEESQRCEGTDLGHACWEGKAVSVVGYFSDWIALWVCIHHSLVDKIAAEHVT